MAQMVVAHHHKAVLRQKAGKPVIAADMFADAVDQLHNGTGRTGFRRPEPGMEVGNAICGAEGKLRYIRHSQRVLSMV